MVKLNEDGKNGIWKLLNTLVNQSVTLRKEKSKLNGVLWSIYGNCQCAISNVDDHNALEVIEMISKKCEEVIYAENDTDD